MKEDLTDLTVLVKKYQERIESLEKDLNEEKRKLNLVTETIALLRKEGNFDQGKLFEAPPVISDRYKEMSMREAIEDVLKSHQPEKLSAEFIYSEITKNGFESGSKNVKRDVWTRLFRLEERGTINSTKKGGVKRYFLPKPEEAKHEAEIAQ